MRKTVFISLIFFILTIQALAVEIKGEVVNLEGKPVAQAIIFHSSSGSKALSDEEGCFSLSLPEEGKIRLAIIHQDYIEQEIVLIAKDAQRKIVIKLIPYIIQREEIVVTALRYPESSASVPAAETVVSKETLEEKMAANITEGISTLPGVSNIGTGGFSMVPNIRGLARSRVLILIDNARITSDRRTGPNASFIKPNDIEKIEVLRSPSSVFYGSDAIGGVIHILTKKPAMEGGIKGNINLKYGTINQEKGLGFSLEGSKKNTGFYLSFQGDDAENYSSPQGEVLQSYFTQGTLFGKVSHMTEKREIHLSLLGSRGKNIGKPAQDGLTRPTWYPRETQNLLQFHWLEKGIFGGGELAFQAFFNPNFLETKRERFEPYRTEESRTDSKDYGFHLSYRKKVGEYLGLTAGTDFYGRASVKAKNVYNTYDSDFDPSENLVESIIEWPFTQGDRKDLGLFLSADYSGLKNLDAVGGIRWDFLRMKALQGDTPPTQRRDYSTWTGFLGSSFKITKEIIVFANLSKAYRAPGPSELFYTGITGRGIIVSQPGLRPETSLNLDAGLKFIFKRWFFGIYSFYYEIDDLIERYLLNPAERIYTYGNIDQGKISGYEVELEYYPLQGWKIFGNFFSFTGKSKITEASLNDIPPVRLYAGTRLWIGRFSAEINATLQQGKKDPGPAEVEIPGYGLVNLKASYISRQNFRLYFILSNLLNKYYLARPDPDGIEEPGRSLILGLSYSF
jgi:outer membrane receptor protein involved in Fe transport